MVNALTDGNSAHPSSSASDQGTQHVASVLVPSLSSKGDGQRQKPNNGARPSLNCAPDPNRKALFASFVIQKSTTHLPVLSMTPLLCASLVPQN